MQQTIGRGDIMLKLNRTNHDYYCEAFEVGARTSEYESWNDFKKEIGLDYKLCYNLLFRFDIVYHDDSEDPRINTYSLYMHHVLQRHGQEIWHVIIHNLTDKDLSEIEKHLKNAKKYLLNMWSEIE